MTLKEKVAVRILDFPGKSGGGCSCGNLALLPEYPEMMRRKAAELREALEARFPGRTSLEYVDLREAPTEAESEAGRLLATGEYPSPLVLVEGQVKYAGSVQVNRIVKDVGALLSPA